jgi:hypothetical protein
MGKLTLDEAIKHCLEVAEEQSRLYSLCPCPCDGTKNCMSLKNGKDMGCTKCAAEHRQLAAWLTELKEAKRLLRLAITDFAKLDRENARNKNCMMPEMDCADCPLSWDSVDDRVEPCHSWRYKNEALKLIGND